jgi:hypothetical protein
MNGDVGSRAESAIRVVRGAVSVGVRDLYSAQCGDQKDTNQRKEDSPGMVGAKSLVCVTHIRHYTNRAGSLLVMRGDGAWVQRASWANPI